jgi:hypothetical protein
LKGFDSIHIALNEQSVLINDSLPIIAANNPNLKSLVLEHVFDTNSHTMLRNVLHNCHALEHFVLRSYDDSFTSQQLNSIFSTTTILNLKHIDIEHTPINTSTVKLIIENCPSLTQLYCRDSSKLDHNEILRYIAELGRNVEYVYQYENTSGVLLGGRECY